MYVALIFNVMQVQVCFAAGLERNQHPIAITCVFAASQEVHPQLSVLALCSIEGVHRLPLNIVCS